MQFKIVFVLCCFQQLFCSEFPKEKIQGFIQKFEKEGKYYFVCNFLYKSINHNSEFISLSEGLQINGEKTTFTAIKCKQLGQISFYRVCKVFNDNQINQGKDTITLTCTIDSMTFDIFFYNVERIFTKITTKQTITMEQLIVRDLKEGFDFNNYQKNNLIISGTIKDDLYCQIISAHFFAIQIIEKSDRQILSKTITESEQKNFSFKYWVEYPNLFVLCLMNDQTVQVFKGV